MVLLMGAAVATLCGVWIVTGLRLVALARRSRALPELLLGLALLLQAGIGFPLSVIAQFPVAYALPIGAVASLCNNTGIGLLYAFTARVFRAEASWAWAAVAVAAGLLATQSAGNLLAQADAASHADRMAASLRWAAGSLLLSGSAWCWTATEALRYHAMLRRRAILGLADPAVANRIFLFGLMAAVGVGCVAIDGLLLYSGIPRARDVLLPLVTAVSGLVTSACTLLAFWPPAAYLARVRGGRSAFAS
jgi:hypothetical protein